MNSCPANSGGSASPIPPPPVVEVFVVLPDGSCIPATRDKLKIVMRQARSEATKRRRLAAKEKADELQRNLDDRAAARRYLQELAEIDLERRRIAATLRVRVKADRPARQTSDVVKRAAMPPSRKPISMTPVPSSWVVDDLGMRGVHYSQSYIGRKSPGFYRGAARDRWLYEARDEAVLRDSGGEPVIIANLGEDLDEIGAAWQAIEDATTRKNGKIQIRLIVAFDADASDAESITALKHFCETVLEPLGLPYSAVIHRAPEDGDERNVHAHILTNFRPTKRVEPYCWSFADHVRGELDGPDGVQMLRHLWAHSMSEAAERAQRNMRYTGLGYGARGLDLEPGEHLHEARSAMVRSGQTVWAYERNRIKQARNAARRAIRDADKKIAALTKLRDAAIAQIEASAAENMQAPRELVRAQASHPVISLVSTAPPSRAQQPQLHTVADSEKPVVPVAAAAVPAAPSSELRAASGGTQQSAPVRVAKQSDMPLRALVTSNEVKQPAAMRVANSEPDTARLTTAASRQPVAARPLRASTTNQTAEPKPLGAGYAPMLADRKQVSQRADQPGVLASTTHWAPPVRLSSAPSPNGATLLSPSRKTDPMPVLELAPPARPPATPLALWPTPDDRSIIAERTRGLLAAIARWRDAESGIAMAARDSAPPKKTAAATPKQGDVRLEARAPTPAILPVVAAYRRRRRFTAGADTGRMNAIDLIPDREWLEDHPRTKFDEHAVRAIEHDERQIERLRRADVYVGDFKAGPLELDPRVIEALKVDGDWLLQAHVQQALRVIRAEQQQVVEALRAEAQARPLAFSKTGPRFWPNDLAPQLKQRLDRWSRDECFGSDMFAIEMAVRQAHRDNDAERNRREVSAPVKAVGEATAAAVRRKAQQQTSGGLDGTGVLAFARKTRKPTRSLLMLIRYAGEYPDRIDLHRNGPRAREGVPETIRSLLDGWRGDARVRQLVVGTVSMSRAAGRPTWPPELSSEMRAIVRNAPAPSWSMHELRLSR